MRVFIDECIDWRLSRDIIGHDVKTAHQIGWDDVKNGALLALVAGKFDMFVTVDRNLAFQNRVTHLSFAVMVLQAHTNRLADLRPLVPDLLRMMPQVQPGQLVQIGSK